VSLIEAVAIAAAAFVAATINAVAGGGSLVSFPVLVATGFGSKVANVTNTVGLVPGLAGGAIGYRDEIRRQPQNVRTILPPTILGAIAGSTILMSTSEADFDAIVPFLILIACGLLALQDRISLLVLGPRLVGDPPPALHRFWLYGGLFVAATYGAYFGAGLGIILFVILGLTLPDDIQRTNALRGLIALFTNGMAATYFALFAGVDWTAAGIMAIAALVGGYFGARLARRLDRKTLRGAVITYGTIAALYLMFS
jgi:uncharacterized membrane protein YfcA